MKKSFLLYIDSLDVLDDLNDQQTAELFRAIRDYQNGTDIKLTGLMKAIFTPFKNQFERDTDKYQKISEKNAENARKRWERNNATASDRMPTDAKHADNGTDNGTDSDKDIKVKKATLSPAPKKLDIPTLKEFTDYAKENVPDIDVEAVELKYKAWIEAKWHDGNGKKIKVWKSKLLNTLKYLKKEVPRNGVGTKSNPHRIDSSQTPRLKTLKL